MNNIEWFKQAKFGMMVHFGLYAILAGEYKGKRMGNFIGEWIQPYFKIPKAEYEKLAGVFNPIYFDAAEWVKIAQDAGMKYIVVTTKHHEGFALFKSNADKFNVVDATPYKKDIIEQLANACAKNNMKLGLYYSQCLDWHEQNGGGYKKMDYNFGLPWSNNWDFDDRKKDFSITYENKIKPQVKEILTQYGDICLVWFDTPMGMSAEQSLELYKIVKKYQPNCLVNSRLGEVQGIKYDYQSCGDNEIPQGIIGESIVYETPATLNDTWGYKSYDQNWKDPKKIIEIKKHLNDRNINYLLNVGPDGLGRIPSASIDILQEVGKRH